MMNVHVQDRPSHPTALMGQFLTGQPSSEFPAQVNERLRTVWTDTSERIKQADNTQVENVQRLAVQVLSAPTRAQRVVWLRRTADVFAKAFDGLVACQKGCAHCCHIPVSLGEAEAQVIGAALGQKPLPASVHAAHDPELVIGTPCSFLAADQSCSIYSVRPSICRAHLSVDEDDLLCRLIEGVAVPVPYANATFVKALTHQATGPFFADIRQWFPAGSVGR